MSKLCDKQRMAADPPSKRLRLSPSPSSPSLEATLASLTASLESDVNGILNQAIKVAQEASTAPERDKSPDFVLDDLIDSALAAQSPPSTANTPKSPIKQEQRNSLPPARPSPQPARPVASTSAAPAKTVPRPPNSTFTLDAYLNQALAQAAKEITAEVATEQAKVWYRCHQTGCNRAYRRLENLRSHLKTHLETKPFMCLSCNIPFSRYHDFSTHNTATHIPLPNLRPVFCTGCSRNFSTLAKLRKHRADMRSFEKCRIGQPPLPPPPVMPNGFIPDEDPVTDSEAIETIQGKPAIDKDMRDILDSFRDLILPPTEPSKPEEIKPGINPRNRQVRKDDSGAARQRCLYNLLEQAKFTAEERKALMWLIPQVGKVDIDLLPQQPEFAIGDFGDLGDLGADLNIDDLVNDILASGMGAAEE